MPTRIALAQMSCTPDRAANLKKALARIEQAAKSGCHIVCLQELFATQYFCQTEDDAHFELAEPHDGPIAKALSQAAMQHKIIVIGGLFEKRADGLYHNSAVVFDTDGRRAGLYRKMHIPDDPCFYEKFYFTPGDSQPGFQAIPTSAGKIGVLICWDQWYPEAARLTALHGAGILFYPTAIGWHPSDPPEIKKQQTDAWKTIQRSHAIANGCFVCSVNRVGREGKLQFWGSSFICGPMGQIIAKATSQDEELLFATIDLAEIDQTRRKWPFLRDRRIEAYENLNRRFID